MKVCRVIKANISVKVGDALLDSKFERKYSEGRAKVESLLENVRKRECPKLFDRENSLFVFPNDDKMEERVFQWASTYAPNPGSSCQVYLLELDVDKVEWHDSRYYEDLYFLLNGMKCCMQNKTAIKEELCKEYWIGKCDMEELSIEGLVNSAKVLSVTLYTVTHNNIRKLE